MTDKVLLYQNTRELEFNIRNIARDKGKHYQ